MFRPLQPRLIVERAIRALGEEGYNVIKDNCEHFATDCRYGEKNSRQVQTVIGGVVATGLLSIVVIGAAYFLGDSSKAEKEEKEKEKEKSQV